MIPNLSNNTNDRQGRKALFQINRKIAISSLTNYEHICLIAPSMDWHRRTCQELGYANLDILQDTEVSRRQGHHFQGHLQCHHIWTMDHSGRWAGGSLKKAWFTLHNYEEGRLREKPWQPLLLSGALWALWQQWKGSMVTSHTEVWYKSENTE